MRFFTGFFDSVTGAERSYSQSELARAFRTLLCNGVSDLDDCLKVVAAQGMQVQVNPGVAMQEGYFGGVVDDGGTAALYTLTASGSAPRYTRIILRQSLSSTDAACSIIVRDGTAAATPVPPALTQDDNWHEISLARILVPAGATSISADNITDERADETVCGVIAPRFLVRSKLPALFRATMPEASASESGLMAKADKSALDTLKGKSTATASSDGWMAAADKSALDTLKGKSTATASSDGWMAKADKSALDTLAAKKDATATVAGWMPAADKTYLDALKAAITVSDTAVDLGGKYLDNALFR